MPRPRTMLAAVATSLAAAAGVALGASALSGRRSPDQTSESAEAGYDGPAVGHDALDMPDEPTDAPLPTAPDPGRPRLRAAARTVSLLSAGALLALVTLTAAGWRGPTGGPVGGDGVEVVFAAPSQEPTTSADPDPTPSAATEPSADPPPSQPLAVQQADPATIRIPAIGVEADVIPLGTTDGVLDVPADFAQTGWWTAGPEPGEVGPAVVVGHVDSFQGPAVFFQLDQLTYDDRIEVVRLDGSVVTFAVRSALQVDKDAFPTDVVYGPTDDAQLRLITCHGDFADGSYLGNYIVTAELVDATPAPTTGPLV